MWLTVLKYVGIPVAAILAICGIWFSGEIHGVNKQRNADATTQLILQKKYDAELLLKTSAVNSIVESYNNTITSIALSNLKSKEELSHDKDFINKHTIISHVFVRDSSPVSLSSTSANSSEAFDQTEALLESTTISDPFRIADWSRRVTIAQWQCVAQLNALIDVVNDNK